MNAAVTGATGFVGRHLVHALLDRGDRVTCLARKPERAAAYAARGARIVGGSLADLTALRRLVEGSEVVFHVAGQLSAHTERDFYRANRGGTEMIATTARESGVARVVYVSSLAATGPAARGHPVDDRHVPNPVSAYGRSKLAGEDALRASGVPFSIVRPPTVYGPADRQTLKVFKMVKLGVVPLLGDGRQELSLLHVTDLAGALLAVATAPNAAGQVYHAAHSEIVTQRQWVEAIGRASGKAVRMVPLSASVTRAALRAVGAAASLVRVQTLFTADKANEFLAPAWTCTSAGLERDCGWKAQIGCEDGAATTVMWYRTHGWL